MGITFRSGDYIKFVRVGGRTIKDGEAAAIWNRNGVHTEIIGPRRVHLFFSTIRFLTRHKAESNQYLVIKHKDGRVENIKGPMAVYQNPAFHDEVQVKDGISLKSSSEFIVVQNSDYAKESAKDLTTVHGPKLFIPSPSDNVHTFSWSQIDGEKIYSAEAETTKLSTSAFPLDIIINVPLINSQFIRARIHVEYKISSPLSLEKLMEHQDPIARMYHAIRVDGQTLGGIITLDMVRNWKQDEMKAIFNNVEGYPELCKAAKQSGLEILTVYLTGQSLSNELKALFDSERAIESKLQSEIKTKTQRQELRVFEQEDKRKEFEHEEELKRMKLESKLQSEIKAKTQRQELRLFEQEDKRKEIEHEEELKRMRLESKLQSEIKAKAERQELRVLEQEEKRKEIEHEEELKRMKLENDDKIEKDMHAMQLASLERKNELATIEAKASNERMKIRDEAVLLFLKKMKDMDVDMTEFLSPKIISDGSRDIQRAMSRIEKVRDVHKA